MELRIKEIPVSENGYEETMKEKVEPFLAKFRKEGFFRGHDGQNIHYEKYLIPDALASVTVVHGFTESAEKFREMAFNFIVMGFNVFLLDQRGHGTSYRYAPYPQTVSVNKFDEYIEDLDIYVNTIVKPDSGDLPLFVYCHSMGGAVTIQYLQTHPGIFKKAVLSAPMVLCKTAGLPQGLALAIARVFCAIGKGHDTVMGFHGFNPDKTYVDSNMTSEARFNYYQAKKCANKDLQTANASYKWLKEAVLVAKKNLDPARCAKIDIPVLLCQPEEDGSVVSEKEDEFIALVPNGKLVRFPASRHEIYGSGDATVLDYLQTIEKFYKE
jgi:lysophospholipase